AGAEAPKQRPGLIGAAQDHAEALRSGDAEAIDRTKRRLESSLRRSRADSQVARDLADHVTGEGDNDAERLDALSARLREETRARRAAASRKRRTARRLERERIRSLLGEVDAELRQREELSNRSESVSVDSMNKSPRKAKPREALTALPEGGA